MATDESTEPRAYPDALRSTVRNNSSAYGYSLSITTSFGLVSALHGAPKVLDAFLFLCGAAVAFILVETVASRGFRQPVRGEREGVMVLGGAMDLFAVLAAAGAAIGAAYISGWPGWLVGGYAATTTYLLVGGIDVLLARRIEKAHISP